MNISKKSWHYKFLKFMAVEESAIPENLCPYVRILIFKIILLVFFTLLSFMLMCIVGEKLNNILFNFSFGSALDLFIHFFVGAIGTAVFSVGAVSTLALIDYIKNRKTTKVGVVSTYIKAKHDKICPKIEFKD